MQELGQGGEEECGLPGKWQCSPRPEVHEHCRERVGQCYRSSLGLVKPLLGSSRPAVAAQPVSGRVEEMCGNVQ